MSNITKLSDEVKSYIIRRKKANNDISCRSLSAEVSEKFKTNIAKSSVSSIFKANKLSSPVGRRVSRIFRPAGETSGVGYVFLLGAIRILGLSKILATVIQTNHPGFRLKFETIEAISEAWIMAKAVYNVQLEKIENYEKSDLWFIAGRKANKGLLKVYIEALKDLQTVNYQLVSELSHVLQDIHCLKIILADGAHYFLDGQCKSVWKDGKMPYEFSITIDILDSYVNSVFFSNKPLVIFSARPETMLGEELSDFIFSLDGSLAPKRIRKIEYISTNGSPVKEAPYIPAGRRGFIMGIWPWQYKAIAELEKRKTTAKFVLEPTGSEFYFLEDQVKFAQHTHNTIVTLRLIILKMNPDGPATVGLLTNLDPKEWGASYVVESYVRHCPDLEAGHRLFIKATQKPGYLEEFISSEKILSEAKKIQNSHDLDHLFSSLVEILNVFSQKVFFPPECSGWSLLKMRELFYKERGFIKRDMASDVVFKLFNINMLQEKELLNFAATKFNEAPVSEFSGRKIWIIPPK